MSPEIYHTLGRLEAVVDRINSVAMKTDDDVVLTLTALLRDRCKELREQFDDQQRVRLEEQLNASIELIGKSPERLRRHGIDTKL